MSGAQRNTEELGMRLFFGIIGLLILPSRLFAASHLNIVRHSPLLPLNGQNLTITAQFSNYDGIVAITIELVRGPIVDCTDRRLVPCRKQAGSSDETFLCQFDAYKPAPSTVSCQTPPLHPFRDELVSYRAMATTRGGSNLEAGEVTLAVGGYHSARELPRLLPILWHSNLWTDNKPANPRHHILFARALDYGDEEGFYDFLTELQSAVGGAFDGQGPKPVLYSRLYSRAIDEFDLWYVPSNPVPLDTGCLALHSDFEFPRPRHLAIVVLHKRPFQDCAISSTHIGSATLYGEASDAPYILVHETGHALFGLADEYPCGGWYVAGDCKNVSQVKCNGCEPIKCNHYDVDPPSWNIDPSADPDIMREASDQADWRSSCLACVGKALHFDDDAAAAAPPILISLVGTIIGKISDPLKIPQFMRLESAQIITLRVTGPEPSATLSVRDVLVPANFELFDGDAEPAAASPPPNSSATSQLQNGAAKPFVGELRFVRQGHGAAAPVEIGHPRSVFREGRSETPTTGQASTYSLLVHASSSLQLWRLGVPVEEIHIKQAP